MRYSSRLFLYAPFVFLLVIATMAMLRWRQLATEWETNLQAANSGQEIARGVTLHFASEKVGGFPFNLDVVFGKFVVTVQSTRGPISLESEHFAIHALTYGRAQQIFEAAGTQILTWTDAEGGRHRFAFVPGTMRASAIERDGRLVRFDVDLDTLASSALTAARVQLHVRDATRNLIDFVIRTDDLRAGSAARSSSDLVIEGQMTQAAALYSLLSGRDEWRHALAAWEVNSGIFRLDHAEITYDNSRLTADGALTLDAGHRLSGRLRMHVSGAGDWKPTRLVESRFTSALQELANAAVGQSSAAASLSLDIHNGAAIVSTAGQSRDAGAIDSIF